ncbi:hypothetical protein CSKR_204042 [Clonorchis sinensis]|uniref:Uncharacterized protein n=1 Tax=Clonorchis sinensis TaxID=79923 RepID=A0A8T1MVL7_CLOSI|nr:hypothetical protein CSKR_204042 [Clonorchis sinensis]
MPTAFKHWTSVANTAQINAPSDDRIQKVAEIQVKNARLVRIFFHLLRPTGPRKPLVKPSKSLSDTQQRKTHRPLNTVLRTTILSPIFSLRSGLSAFNGNVNI